MPGPRLSAAQMAQRRQTILQTAFRLFSRRNIDSVLLPEIAQESGCALRTLYRYFPTKADLVVSAATWAFENFMTTNRKQRRGAKNATAAEDFAFFLDSFLALYRDHADLLRFNQMFNVFVRASHINAENLRPYQGLMDDLRARFRAVYEKGTRDGTLRVEFPEEEMFSATLHLMLAVVTRYAVGLVYQGGVEPERELLVQKEMLLARYTKS